MTVRGRLDFGNLLSTQKCEGEEPITHILHKNRSDTTYEGWKISWEMLLE